MRYGAVVSFEHDTMPVRTYRGEIVCPNARLGARRAVEAASRAYPKARWRSIVIVLEKLDDPEATDAKETAELPHPGICPNTPPHPEDDPDA